MWSTGLRCRLRSTPGVSVLRAARLAPRQIASQAALEAAPEESESGQCPQGGRRILQGELSPQPPSLRKPKDENAPPPHLPLPPPLPYSPTSKPFLRHVQILDESILSRSTDHSWEIFNGLHPDLHSALPRGTLSNLLHCQSLEPRRPRRFTRLRQLLGLVHAHKIRLRTSELEQAVYAIIEASQERMDNREIFEIAMSLLCESTGGRPEKIDQAVRMAWFDKAYRWQHSQALKSTPDWQKQQSSMLSWIRAQADRGYLRGLALRVEYLTPKGRHHLVGQALEQALELCAYLLHHNLAAVELASETMITGHLMERAGHLNMGVSRGNRGIEAFIRAVGDAGRGEIAQSIWTRSYTSATGGIPAVATLLEMPSHLTLADADRDLLQAQKTLQRSLAHKNAYHQDQLGRIRQALAASATVIDELVTDGAALDQSFARALFRLVSGGPFAPKVDPGYVDVKKAVIYIFRKLSTTGHLGRMPDRTQGTAMKALLRFSSRPSDVDLFRHVYHQTARGDGDLRSWKWAPDQHKSMTELIGSAIDKHTPSSTLLAVELYAQWLSDGLPQFRPSLSQRIVHALSRIDDENAAVYLRGLHRGEQARSARSVVINLLRRAISDTQSGHVAGVYAQIIVAHEIPKDRTDAKGSPSTQEEVGRGTASDNIGQERPLACGAT